MPQAFKAVDVMCDCAVDFVPVVTVGIALVIWFVDLLDGRSRNCLDGEACGFPFTEEVGQVVGELFLGAECNLVVLCIDIRELVQRQQCNRSRFKTLTATSETGILYHSATLAESEVQVGASVWVS